MKIVFRIHAIERMFERNISPSDIRQILKEGKDIESYPDDDPYPSRLVLGWIDDRPIHVVVADDQEAGMAIVISAYEPDSIRWEQGFQRRRSQ